MHILSTLYVYPLNFIIYCWTAPTCIAICKKAGGLCLILPHSAVLYIVLYYPTPWPLEIGMHKQVKLYKDIYIILYIICMYIGYIIIYTQQQLYSVCVPLLHYLSSGWLLCFRAYLTSHQLTNMRYFVGVSYSVTLYWPGLLTHILVSQLSSSIPLPVWSASLPSLLQAVISGGTLWLISTQSKILAAILCNTSLH